MSKTNPPEIPINFQLLSDLRWIWPKDSLNEQTNCCKLPLKLFLWLIDVDSLNVSNCESQLVGGHNPYETYQPTNNL